MARTKAEWDDMAAELETLRGSIGRLRAGRDEARGLAERRLRLIKKQRAYIDALAAAAMSHGLSLGKPVEWHLNEIAGSDDAFVAVTLRETHAGWARGEAAVGHAWVEGDATRVIDWETGRPPEEVPS